MASEIDAHLGQRLRRRRWMLGLTQSQLGDRVGIKFQQVQKYETGQNRISASRLWQLANAVGVEVSYFYDGLDTAGDETGLPADPIDEAALGVAGVEPEARDATVVEEKPDLLDDREAIELVRSVYMLPETPRRRLFDFVKSLSVITGGASSNGDKDDARLRAG